MSGISRLFLLGAVCCGYGTLAVLAVVGIAAAPEITLILLAVLLAAAVGGKFRPKPAAGNPLGGAKWMTAWDALRRWAIGTGGMPVGSLDPPTRKEAFSILRKASPGMNRQACRVFWAWWTKRRLPVTLSDFVNMCIVSPVGMGKSSAYLGPALLHLDWNAVALDIKGELYRWTHGERKRRGHRIVCVNPFGMAGLPSGGRFNPLASLRYDDPFLPDKARMLSESLVERTGHEHDRHWQDVAVVVIQTAILFVVARAYTLHTTAGVTLAEVAGIIASPNRLTAAAEALIGCPDHGGILRDLGYQVAGLQDKERASVISSANRALAFTQTNAVREATAESDFDPADLRGRKKVTVYLCVPPQYLKSHRGLIRCYLQALLTACVDAGVDRHSRVLFALDEYAAIGRTEIVEQALTLFRGFGVRLLFSFQSVKQMEVAFPDGGPDLVLGNCTNVFMGVRDYHTAEIVSKSIGVHTVTKLSTSGGTNSGSSYGPDGGGSRSFGGNDGWSTDQVARELIKPEEVMQLGDRLAVVLHGNLPPMLLRTHRLFDPDYRRVLSRGGGFRLFVGSLLVFLLSAGVCVGSAVALLPEAARVGEQYRKRAVEMNRTPPPGMQQQQPGDPDPFDPGVVKDAFGQVARDRNGVAVRIPPGMHVEHDTRTGTAWLVRNGDRMFR